MYVSPSLPRRSIYSLMRSPSSHEQPDTPATAIAPTVDAAPTQRAPSLELPRPTPRLWLLRVYVQLARPALGLVVALIAVSLTVFGTTLVPIPTTRTAQIQTAQSRICVWWIPFPGGYTQARLLPQFTFSKNCFRDIVSDTHVPFTLRSRITRSRPSVLSAPSFRCMCR